MGKEDVGRKSQQWLIRYEEALLESIHRLTRSNMTLADAIAHLGTSVSGAAEELRNLAQRVRDAGDVEAAAQEIEADAAALDAAVGAASGNAPTDTTGETPPDTTGDVPPMDSPPV